MILKSLSRKSSTFRNLIYYMEKPDKPLGANLFWNINSVTPEDMIYELQENARYITPRKNGNLYYHEIIAIEINPYHNRQTLESALFEAAEDWLGIRAPDHLAYARCHIEQTTAHIHILVSANPIMADRVSISREDFKQMRRQCIDRIANRYPELKLPRLYHRNNPNHEQQKENLKNRIQSVISQPITHLSPSLKDRLYQAGFRLYKRGKKYGVADMNNDGKRHRLDTLELLDQFLEIRQREQQAKLDKQQLESHVQRIRPHYEAMLEQNLIPEFDD